MKYVYRIIDQIKFFLKGYWYNRTSFSAIHRTAMLNRTHLTIGKYVTLEAYVIIRHGQGLISVGDYTQINPFTVIYGGSGVSIGKHVLISPHVMIAAGNHDFIQTKIPMRFSGDISKGPIVISDDVWIGSHACITDGVNIGTGAVIGAGAVVTTNIPDYAIAAGIPAKVIGYRK